MRTNLGKNILGTRMNRKCKTCSEGHLEVFTGKQGGQDGWTEKKSRMKWDGFSCKGMKWVTESLIQRFVDLSVHK